MKSNANAYDQSSVVIYTGIIEVSFVRYSVMYIKLILILVLRKVRFFSCIVEKNNRNSLESQRFSYLLQFLQ